MQRNLSTGERVLAAAGQLLATVAARPQAVRPFPGTATAKPNTATTNSTANNSTTAELSEDERRRASRYIRVNHVGEVCAQALYAAQALTARTPEIRAAMQQAAAEETYHLGWCAQRLDELGGRKSLLNPLWGVGAFAIGGLAGLAGGRWSLGFVAESERQVAAHLQSHLAKLPVADMRSRELLQQMHADELKHMQAAREAGGAQLPPPIRAAMKLSAKVMTSLAYWI